MSRARGFTLVELLIALAIFALLSAFAYRGLDSMLKSREALERDSRKWRDVTLFMGRLERDVGAVLPRRSLSASGTPLAAMSSDLDLATVREGLALTRAGSPLQEGALAAPRRVAYRLREGRIERLAWASADAAPREEPAAVTVLDDVAVLQFRFMDPRGEWRTGWGLPGSADPLPAAVEVTFRLASGEQLVRLLDLPRPLP